MKIVIVTGMSGAGKSAALNVFEDLGYYTMDNLPPSLIPPFVELSKSSRRKIERMAVVIDIRGLEYFDGLEQAIDTLAKDGEEISILFLDAKDEVLVKRYKELRRPHPLEPSGNILEGISRERELLQKLRSAAHRIIDTSPLILGELKEEILEEYEGSERRKGISVSLVSFGFKHGILLDADLVFDVRFIPNPYYIAALKNLTGLDAAVRDFVLSKPVTEEFIRRLMEWLDLFLPYYEKEGKESLVIGIGCTGGCHRSVAIAEALRDELMEKGVVVYGSHRDRRYWN